MIRDTILKILDEFRKHEILQEINGMYEIKHDSLAGKIHTRRSAEDKKRIEATQIVYDTIKNKGTLNEKQLAIIEPYIFKLYLKEEDKEEVMAWVNDQINNIELAKIEKDNQIATQTALREVAELNEIEAVKQKEIADHRKKNARRLVGVAGILFMIMLWLFILERKSKLELLIEKAKYHLNNDNFYLTFSTLDEIASTSNFVPSFILPVALKNDLIYLRNILLFHIVANEIVTNNEYVLYSDFYGVNIKNADKVAYYEIPSNKLKINYSLLKSIGFSKNADKFYTAERNIKLNKQLLKLYNVNAENLQLTSKTIDTVNIAAAAFDKNNFLNYYKNQKIYKYVRDKIEDSINTNFGDERKFGKVTLDFIDSKQSIDSSYLLVTIDNFYYLKNISSKNTNFQQLNKTDVAVLRNRSRSDDSDHSFSPDKKKFFLIKPDSLLAGYIDNNNKKIYNLQNARNINNDSLIAALATNEVLLYVYLDLKTGIQKVCFLDYGISKQKIFNVPQKWEFAEIKNNKFLIFNKYDEKHEMLIRQALLLISNKMAKENSQASWFNQ